MSAHGVPGAFSSALSILWKGILIIVSIFLLSKLFVYLFPDFGQDSIKNKFSSYYGSKNVDEEINKNKYNFNIFKPDTWTYEAMIKRQGEAKKKSKDSPDGNKNKYIQPIVMPSIDEYNKKNNPAYKTNYYENVNKNTAEPSDWTTDGSVWKQTGKDWNQ
jgi:hypothetical protein